MEAVREWIASVIRVSMLVGLVQMLPPKGSCRNIAAFTGGLIVMAALLWPLAGRNMTALLPEADLGEAVSRRQAELEQGSLQRLEEDIAERTEAYISDKAESLGAEVTVRVSTELSEEGIPLPWQAELTGVYLPALAEYMEQELGLPMERQIWHEDES